MMETMGIVYYLTIVWAVLQALGIIALFYFVVKLCIKLTNFLEVKTKYLEQQMGIDRD